jgi:hypothetical protein
MGRLAEAVNVTPGLIYQLMTKQDRVITHEFCSLPLMIM